MRAARRHVWCRRRRPPAPVLRGSLASPAGKRSGHARGAMSSTGAFRLDPEAAMSAVQPAWDAVKADASAPFLKAADAPKATFDVARFRANLETRALGRAVACARVATSTQDFVAALAAHKSASAPLGLVAVADHQAKGRGRGDNVWTDDGGGGGVLATTMLWQFAGRDATSLASLQHLVCVAAAQAAGGALRIKWPNDLYARVPPTGTADVDGPPRIVTPRDGVAYAKAGGVLCTASVAPARRDAAPGCPPGHAPDVGDGAVVYDVAIGVGVNVAPNPPFASLAEAVAADATPPAREEVLARLCNALEPLLERHARSGFDGTIREEYKRRWVHDGHVLRVVGEDSDVELEDVTDKGFLVARVLAGPTSRVELHPDQHSVDLMQGLVVAKRV